MLSIGDPAGVLNTARVCLGARLGDWYVMGKKERELRGKIVNEAERFKPKMKRGSRRRLADRRWYTDEDKAAALVYLQSRGGVINRAARELGIPVMTLSSWAAGNFIVPNVARQFRVVKARLSAKLENVAHQVLDELPDKIEEASLVDLGATLGLIIDRMKLMREGPTAISDIVHRREMLERLIQRTMEQFPGMSREEIIDIIRDVKPEAIKLLS